MVFASRITKRETEKARERERRAPSHEFTCNRRDGIERRDFIKIRRPLNSPKTATSLPCHFYFAETAVYYVTMPRPDAPNAGELTAAGGEGTVAGYSFYTLTPLYTPHGQLYRVVRARARARVRGLPVSRIGNGRLRRSANNQFLGVLKQSLPSSPSLFLSLSLSLSGARTRIQASDKLHLSMHAGQLQELSVPSHARAG